LWPWNSQTEWNQPRQWKRINEIWKETWNVCTLHRAGAINELVKETDKYRLDICVLQEIRWLGKGTVTKRIMILYSGHKSDKQFDTGVFISRHIMDNVLDITLWHYLLYYTDAILGQLENRINPGQRQKIEIYEHGKIPWQDCKTNEYTRCGNKETGFML